MVKYHVQQLITLLHSHHVIHIETELLYKETIKILLEIFQLI